MTGTCPHCGGTVREVKDAKGSVGGCESCGMAVPLTKAAQEEIKAQREEGHPTGGVAPIPEDWNLQVRPDTGDDGTEPEEGPSTVEAQEELAQPQTADTKK